MWFRWPHDLHLTVTSTTDPNKPRNVSFQIDLWPNRPRHPGEERPVIRPIHYLGSKLRLTDPIKETLDELDPERGVTADLFAGSGTVSSALSDHRDVVAVDIQEYSRVLCTAILKPAEAGRELLASVLTLATDSDWATELRKCMEPLIRYEDQCIEQALSGDADLLCDLLEHGSIYALQEGAADLYAETEGILQGTIERLDQTGFKTSPMCLTTRYYGGVYFSYRQAVEIDCLLEAIDRLEPEARESFVAGVLSTASDAVNTVGKHFAQPIRPRRSDGTPKPNLANQVQRDRSINILSRYQEWMHRYLSLSASGRDHRVERADYRTFLEEHEGPLDVVYADPPYTRDHYSRFYHILETICLRDNPEITTTYAHGEERLSRGLYRKDRHQSPFCIKSKAKGAFVSLFEGVRSHDVPLVLSYSPQRDEGKGRARVMSVNALQELAGRFFDDVELRRPGSIAHNKLNKRSLNTDVSYNAEILLVCK